MFVLGGSVCHTIAVAIHLCGGAQGDRKEDYATVMMAVQNMLRAAVVNVGEPADVPSAKQRDAAASHASWLD